MQALLPAAAAAKLMLTVAPETAKPAGRASFVLRSTYFAPNAVDHAPVVRVSVSPENAVWAELFSSNPNEESRRSQADEVTVVDTLTLIVALATSPEVPIAYTV